MLEQHVAAGWDPRRWADFTTIVAVSGGPDSVALLRVLQALRPADGRGQLIVAHFNHHWRGAESDEDQRFVQQLGEQLKLPVVVGHAEPAAEGTSEQRARELRYGFLQQTCRAQGARWVALGHTGNDQVETVLHRIVRGTGLDGLTGMSATRQLDEHSAIVRPLLRVTRADVLDYLATVQQSYREDSSNRSEHWTRNRLRHALLPLLRAQFNPQVDRALARLAELAAEQRDLVADLIEPLLEGCVEERTGDCVVLKVPQLAAHSLLVRRELLRRIWKRQGWPEQAMDAAAWRRLAEFVGGTPAGMTLPYAIEVRREHDRLTLARG